MLNHGHILTAAEMQRAEQDLIAAGVSVEQLMKRAGEGAAQWIWRLFGEMPALLLCGPGNNGGDGYVIAEWLREKGADVTLAAISEPKTNAAKDAQSQWQGKTVALNEAEPGPLFIDCLFGTGLTRPVKGEPLAQLQTLHGKAKKSVAIDLPSGVETDSGAILSPVSRFDLTIALGTRKPAHFLQPAAGKMGNIVDVDIGVMAQSDLRMLTKPELKMPGAGDHKYSRGLIAIIGGEMSGAAMLGARAAQISGAGYVKLFANGSACAPDSTLVSIDCASPAALEHELEDDRIAAVLIGPGLGRSDMARKRLEVAMQCAHPLVLDADALTLLGNKAAETLNKLTQPVVVTPHDGEFAPMAGTISGSKIDRTRAFAEASGAVTLLKGADTVIARPDGQAVVTQSASAWLSTAGSGDVLAGIIAARLAVEGDDFAAAQQGQWLHARAAALAPPAFGADQLVDQIPAAFSECL